MTGRDDTIGRSLWRAHRARRFHGGPDLRFRPCALSAAPSPATAQTPPLKPLAVEVTNASTPESCAEKDNVIINFASANVRRFQIGAVLPAYIGSVNADRREPNWTDCDIPHDADLPPPMERRITFYESPFMWVTGYEVSDYWLRRDVPVRIGERVEHDLTMLQLWVFVRGKAEQVLVLYPTSGMWRPIRCRLRTSPGPPTAPPS